MEKNIKFEDAQKLRKEHPKTFYAPTREELNRITPGDFVKVCAFQERFWVEVKSVKDGQITARIDNDLITPHLRYDQIISFRPENVYNILPAPIREKLTGEKINPGNAKKFKKKGPRL